MDFAFLKYLFGFLLVVLVHYLVGYAIERLFKIKYNEAFQSHFFRLLKGVFLLVFLAAIIYSHGNTVMLGLMVPFIFLLINRNEIKTLNTQKNQEHFSKSGFLILLSGGILIFLVQYFSIFNGGEFPVMPDGDTFFYSNVSNYLSKYKIESLSLDFLQMGKHGCEPYHFFDIWMNTYCKDVLKLNSFLTFKLIVYPLGIVTLFAGYCALAEQSGFKSKWFLVVCFLFLFFSGIYFSLFEKSKYLSTAVLFFYIVFTYPKICYVFILLQASVICHKNGWRNVALTLYAVLPLLFITLLPAVLISIFILGFRSYLNGKKLSSFINDVMACAAVVGFIGLFYYLQPKAETVNAGKMADVFAAMNHLNYFKEIINIAGLTILQNLIVYIVLLIIVLVAYSVRHVIAKMMNHELTFMAIVIYFSSLISWALFHQLMDTVQLFFNMSIPLITVGFFVIYSESLKIMDSRKKILVNVLVLSVLSFRIFQFAEITIQKENLYSAAYLKTTTEQVKNNFSYGGFLFDNSNYTSAFSRNATFRIRGSYLTYANSDFFCYSLSFPESASGLNDSLQNGNLENYNSHFFSFISAQKKAGTFVSVARSRIDFIDYFKIKYIFLTREVVVDSLLQSRFTQTITDSKTGERFCIINH